jgi:hypothetical protein
MMAFLSKVSQVWHGTMLEMKLPWDCLPSWRAYDGLVRHSPHRRSFRQRQLGDKSKQRPRKCRRSMWRQRMGCIKIQRATLERRDRQMVRRPGIPVTLFV